jgi:hypothetical protein
MNNKQLIEYTDLQVSLDAIYEHKVNLEDCLIDYKYPEHIIDWITAAIRDLDTAYAMIANAMIYIDGNGLSEKAGKINDRQ